MIVDIIATKILYCQRLSNYFSLMYRGEMAEHKGNSTSRRNNSRTIKNNVRKMSKDPARSGQLRHKVYDAVVKTLHKRRSGSFTLDEIAAKIGGSKGIIYYYFKSKGDLLYKLNLYFWSFVQASFNSFANNIGLTAREKLVALIRNYVIVSCEHWQLSNVLWSDIALGEGTPGQARAITRSRRSYIRFIAGLVEEIIREEKLEKVNPKVAALMIFGLVVYVPTWYKGDGILSPEDVADYAVKMTFEGILSKKQSV
jgi:AcrR family transcriptional regulator